MQCYASAHQLSPLPVTTLLLILSSVHALHIHTQHAACDVTTSRVIFFGFHVAVQSALVDKCNTKN